MSFITSASLYAIKVQGGPEPYGKFYAADANQISGALMDLRSQFVSGVEVPLTVIGPSGSASLSGFVPVASPFGGDPLAFRVDIGDAFSSGTPLVFARDAVHLFANGGAGGGNSRTMMYIYGTNMDDPTPGAVGDGSRIRFYMNDASGSPVLYNFIESHIEDPTVNAGMSSFSFHVTSGSDAFAGPAFMVRPWGVECRSGGAPPDEGDLLAAIRHEGKTGSVDFQVPFGALTMSAASGVMVSGSDFEVTGSVRGLILTSPNGTRWRITATDAGSLTLVSL